MLTNKRAHDADTAYGESPPTGPALRVGTTWRPRRTRGTGCRCRAAGAARPLAPRRAHGGLRGAWCTLHVALPCCALSGGWNVAALVACGALDREARQHCTGIEPCACNVTCSASRCMFARCHLRAMAPARTVAACAISRSKAHRGRHDATPRFTQDCALPAAAVQSESARLPVGIRGCVRIA